MWFKSFQNDILQEEGSKMCFLSQSFPREEIVLQNMTPVR